MEEVALAAIVLGAGRGTRMGGPKALLTVGGETLLARHVARAYALGCARIVLVVNEDIAPRIDARACPEVVLAVSGAPDPAGSLAIGVKELPRAVGRVIITPVDVLPAGDDIVSRLLAAVDDGALAATPLLAGRGGHPVVCRPEVLSAYALSEPPPLRDVLRALGAARARVAVDDPAVACDLDTPDDLQEPLHFAARVTLSRGTPLRLKYPR